MEEKKKPQKSLSQQNLEELISRGIEVEAVKFQNPVAPAKNKEPVHEFKLEPKNTKYSVDKIWRCPGCIIFEAYGKLKIVEAPNVNYSEPIF